MINYRVGDYLGDSIFDQLGAVYKITSIDDDYAKCELVENLLLSDSIVKERILHVDGIFIFYVKLEGYAIKKEIKDWLNE